MRHFSILLLALAAFATSCGSDEDKSPDPAEALDELGESLTQAHCSRLLSCCNAEERGAAFGGIPVATEEECGAAVEGIIQVNVIPRYEAALQAGSVTYDASGRQNCIDGLLRTACDSFEPDPRFAIDEVANCRGLFTAQLETTEFCTEDFECKSGFCALSASGEEGTCAEEPRAGESCIAGRCAFGLYCNADQVCSAQFPDGSGCQVDAECESDNCVDVSLPEDPSEFRCQALPPACGG